MPLASHPPLILSVRPTTIKQHLWRANLANGYLHGPVDCHICFEGREAVRTLGLWRLHNNPGYYGSATPRILVLGFSKGANQNQVVQEGDFDQVAFAKARHRLQKVLDTLGLMPADRGIDALMTKKENEFGFASLVRCSLCKIKNGTWRTSGDVIMSALSNRDTLEIIRTCASTYLERLPNSIKIVVLLGTSDNYISKTKEIYRELFSDFSHVNEVAFRAGNALWIYATHPSPGMVTLTIG